MQDDFKILTPEKKKVRKTLLLKDFDEFSKHKSPDESYGDKKRKLKRWCRCTR